MDLEIWGDENQIMFVFGSMWSQGFPEIFSMDLKMNLHGIHCGTNVHSYLGGGWRYLDIVYPRLGR